MNASDFSVINSYIGGECILVGDANAVVSNGILQGARVSSGHLTIQRTSIVNSHRTTPRTPMCTASSSGKWVAEVSGLAGLGEKQGPKGTELTFRARRWTNEEAWLFRSAPPEPYLEVAIVFPGILWEDKHPYIELSHGACVPLSVTSTGDGWAIRREEADRANATIFSQNGLVKLSYEGRSTDLKIGDLLPFADAVVSPTRNTIEEWVVSATKYHPRRSISFARPWCALGLHDTVYVQQRG